MTNLGYAYPLVFLVTTVSIFFRPARAAVLDKGASLLARSFAKVLTLFYPDAGTPKAARVRVDCRLTSKTERSSGG